MLDHLGSRARALLAAYAVLALANIVLSTTDAWAATTATKATLMPLLFGVLMTATTAPRGRTVRWTGVALGASWLGDLALQLDGETWFMAGLGAFLVAQLCYLRAFWPWARTGPVRRRPVLVVPYLAWWVLILVVLGPDLDEMLVPVVVYGLILVAMAAAATGLGRVAATGAALFVLSDSLIAATSLSDRFAFDASGAAVMTTYTLGQALIVLGVIATARRPAEAVGTRP